MIDLTQKEGGGGQQSIPASLAWAHSLVQDWFVEKFGTPTEPQEEGWPHILSGRSTLIAAPTGSGKTLAAFLACIDRLVRKAVTGQLENKIEVVYVSPLKALGNDIQTDRKSTRLNSSHVSISYAVFCLKKKK